MKGPYGKRKSPVRRTWECPLCGRREWTGGEVVNQACTCKAKVPAAAPVWMRLVLEEPTRIVIPKRGAAPVEAPSDEQPPSQ